MVRARKLIKAMEKSKKVLRDLPAAGLLLLAACTFSCNKIPVDIAPGTLSWSIDAPPETRTLVAPSDTDAYLLRVQDAAGNTLYEGTYGASPVSLLVDPGTYTVRLQSIAFTHPDFDAPQFGDEQAVVVVSGAQTRVRLHCTQQNAGIRLVPSETFVRTCPDGSFLLSGRDGQLTYTLDERRTAFFNPGEVDISLVSGGTSTLLLTRALEANEMRLLRITCSDPGEAQTPSGNGLSVEVDTSRVWLQEDFSLGSDTGSLPGSSVSCAYSVSQARSRAGETEVWVCGYVVGGDLSSSQNGISFTPPFTSQTNLALAVRSSVTDKSSCLSVQLAKGKIRDALNLVDHPQLLGRKVYLKGNLVEAYYGIPGMQDITDYMISE